MTRASEARAALQAHRESEAARAPDLFSAFEERDQAIASTELTWRGDALKELDRAVERLARSRPWFTTDDVRDELVASQPVTGIDRRALGGVLRRAARRGLIAHGGFVPSRYRHASPIVRWKSRVCEVAS